MEKSRRSFLALLGIGGIAIPLVPQIVGLNSPPKLPETAAVADAAGVLQMDWPRPPVDRWFDATSLDGRAVKIGAVDLGDMMYGVTNSGEVYPTFVSYFECEGRYCFSAVDKALCCMSGDMVAFRMAEDCAIIEGLGVNPNSIEFI